MAKPSTASVKPGDDTPPGQELNTLKAEFRAAHPDVPVSEVNQRFAPGRTRREMAGGVTIWARGLTKK